MRQSGSTSTATRTGLRAGSYLPSRDNALLAFLGVRRDGKTASFHVAAGVDVVGKDRKCSQGTATHCRTLQLRPGDSVRLDSTLFPGWPVTSYRFRVIKVAPVK